MMDYYEQCISINAIVLNHENTTLRTTSLSITFGCIKPLVICPKHLLKGANIKNFKKNYNMKTISLKSSLKYLLNNRTERVCFSITHFVKAV